MKKLFIILNICLLATYCMGQQSANDFVYSFIFPTGNDFLGDGSSIEWTLTDKTTGCIITNSDKEVKDNFTVDNEAIFGPIAVMVNKCKSTPMVGDILEMEVTVVKGTHTGKTMKWTDKIKLAEDGGSYGIIYLEFEVVTPTIKVTGTSLCKGENGEVTAVLTNAPANYTIDWGDAKISTKAGNTATSATGTVSGLTSTASNIKAKLKDASGNVVAESEPYTVTVNSLPTVTITPLQVCDGVETQYLATATNIKSYKWGEAASGTSQRSNKVVLTAASSNKKVSVEVTDNNGCKATDTKTITVNPLPTVTLTAGETDVCKGSDVVLTATAAGATFDWGNGTFAATDTKTVTVSALNANNYTVKAKDGKGCVGTANVSVNGHEMELTLTPDKGTVNMGEATDITAAVKYQPTNEAATGAETYTWKKEGSAMQETTATVSTGDLNATTKFEVEVTGGKYGCKAKDNVTINVSGSALAVNPTGGEGCAGSVITLNAGASGGKPTYKYTWKPSAGLILSSNSAEKPTVDPATPAGTYTATVEVTDNNGAGTPITSNPVTIKVVQKPSITGISADPTTVTAGGNSQLEVQVTPASAQVSWSGGTLSSTTGTRVTAQNIAATTTYTANATITDGATTCSDTKPIQVSVSAPADQPTLNWTMTDQICANPGNTRQITLTASGGGAGATYSFVVSAPDGTAAKTVTNDANTSWTVIVDAADAGDYVVGRFSATAGGTTTNGVVLPSQTIKVEFWPVPTVFAHGAIQNSTLQHCSGDQLVLSGSGGEAGTTYTWDNGISNGQPFTPAITTTYTVTGKTPHSCVGTDQVTVTVNQKPELTAPADQEICVNDPVTLTATSATAGATIAWNNNVQNGIAFNPSLTSVYIATVTDPATGCTRSDSVTVVVNQAPEIVSASKNPRNIAIGKDVAFSVKATGKNLTYQWQKNINGVWTTMTDVTNMTPLVNGATSDSLVLKQVPKEWDGSEFKCIVIGDCGTTESEVFKLGVKECFDIHIQMFMEDGILPDNNPGNEIDGWYCIGNKIALRALITSEEGYEIENPHYTWTIDGLPAGPKVYESDSAVISWVPEYYEDDIVIKVCGYSDGACEEVCAHYLRLKARRFEDVSMKLLTSVDPEHAFCPGDTVNCWVETANAGDSVSFEWYNDIFKLPEESSPKNEVVYYADNKITLKMGQEDTWVKVFMTPSKEVCTDQKVFVDTVFLRKKQEVQPWLKIVNSIEDTVACQGDRIMFTAYYENAGTNPTIEWRKDIWDWGYGQHVEAALDDKDMWMRCKLTPGKDVCYNGAELIDTMVIRVLELSKVTIWADMTNKQPGDEIVVESEVENMPTQAHYEWYINTYMATVFEPEYVSDKLAQGDVVVCAVSGERICQNRVFSNELVINFGNSSRDTTITIYAGERIQNLDLKKPGDTEDMVFQIADNGHATLGMSSLSYDGIFNYVPNVSLGADRVKYEVYNKFNKDKVETGNVYIKIIDRPHFFIPNIITPNDDGLNDTWKLDFLADYPDHLITVYNRNGKVVFQAKNYNNDWDGTGQTTSSYVSNFNLSNGVYTYVIDLGNKQILKNWLEIRRDMNRGKYKY